MPIALPSVDISNPLYCPAISPSTYIHSLRTKARLLHDRTRRARRSSYSTARNADRNKDLELFVSFASSLLEKGLDSGSRDESGMAGLHTGAFPNNGGTWSADILAAAYKVNSSWIDDTPSDHTVRHRAPPDQACGQAFDSSFDFSRLSGAHISTPLSPKCLSLAEDQSLELGALLENVSAAGQDRMGHGCSPASVTDHKMMDRTVHEFSDLEGSPQHAPSDLEVDLESFDVDVTRERLDYAPRASLRPCSISSATSFATMEESDDVKLPLEFIAPTEATMKRLAGCLDAVFSGTRLGHRLMKLATQSPQSYADYLGEHGLITSRVLELLSGFRITRLVFADTEKVYESGLNMPARNLFQSFLVPGNFCALKEVVFSDHPLDTSDVRFLLHLPNLTVLRLDGSDVNNEVVFILVALKNLKMLSLSCNPLVTDDAIPAICCLTELQYLSLLGTGVTRMGLRKLGIVMGIRNWAVRIEVGEEMRGLGDLGTFEFEWEN